MRAENNDPFGIRRRPFGTGRIVGIGFATRPSGDRVLHVIKYLDIHFVGTAEHLDQVHHAVFGVILIFYFEYGLFNLLAKPYHRFPD